MATLEDYKKYDPLPLSVTNDTGYTIGVFGASKQGKSNAIVWLWKKYFHKHITILCSPNFQQEVYDPFRKKAIITPYFDTAAEIIKLALEIQQGTKNKYRFLFILDDVITAKNNKVLSDMVLTLRNSNISSIISLQGGTLMNIHLRNSINAVLCFRFNGNEGAKGIVERYLMDALQKPSLGYKVFEYQKMTEGHHFIIGNLLEHKFALTKLPSNLLSN